MTDAISTAVVAPLREEQDTITAEPDTLTAEQVASVVAGIPVIGEACDALVTRAWRGGQSVDTRVSHPCKKVGLRVLRTTATTWMFEESNDDRDTAQDRAGMGRIL